MTSGGWERTSMRLKVSHNEDSWSRFRSVWREYFTRRLSRILSGRNPGSSDSTTSKTFSSPSKPRSMGFMEEKSRG